jgi:hypothetical protein
MQDCIQKNLSISGIQEIKEPLQKPYSETMQQEIAIWGWTFIHCFEAAGLEPVE